MLGLDLPPTSSGAMTSNRKLSPGSSPVTLHALVSRLESVRFSLITAFLHESTTRETSCEGQGQVLVCRRRRKLVEWGSIPENTFKTKFVASVVVELR